MKNKDSLKVRMKIYENVTRNYLTMNCPKVIRLDMRAGHSFTKGFARPFDDIFSECMIFATKRLCEEIPGAVFGYTQSDEISIVMNDISKNGNSNCMFDGNISKIISISASICTIEFNKKYLELTADKPADSVYKKRAWTAQFDSRVFCLPNVQEVHNYVLFRQQDATKNSIQSVGRAYFSQKELNGKNSDEIQDMLMIKKGVNWNNIQTKYKRGCIVVKEAKEKETFVPYLGETVKAMRSSWEEKEIPILTKDTEFIKNLYEKQ